MVAKKIAAIYSLRKSKKILRSIYRQYARKEKYLDQPTKERLQSHITNLQRAINQKEANLANQIAHQLEETASRLIPRTTWDRARDFIGAISFALLIAIVIRQMWFEPYTIPTGSMRPTLKESDYLVVTKTDYGLNVPLNTAHFYFDPSLVQRGAIVVFTSENLDLTDSDTNYFYLFPGKKQFVKRLIGKPGDILYFYGGEIYGVSAEGKELKMLRSPSWFQEIEHIPFIRFDGKVETPKNVNGIFSPAIFYQMNEPVAKMSVSSIGTVTGEMIPQKGRPSFAHYSDLWGMKNFAMARLLNKTQMEKIHPDAAKDLEEAPLYLELTHHPSLQNGVLIRDENNRVRPELGTSTSLLPLQQKQIDAIADQMTTCRFVVKNGIALRYGWNPKDLAAYLPRFPDVPDGTYEIQQGKAYKIWGGLPILGLFGGFATELPLNHPLYKKTPQQVQLLYDLGIEFLTPYLPQTKNQRIVPSRYAYFRDGELYLLGAPILTKNDPILIRFLQREYQKQSISTSINPYYPFDDNGPPLNKDGTIDVEFVRKNGIQVPEKMYLVLGDNHAMSADSRAFGFVPEANLKGGVSFLFSPPGPRWGRLPQPHHPLFTLPNLIVWGSSLLISLASYYYRRKFSGPLF